MPIKLAIVVDDRPLQRGHVRDILKGLGYTVTECENSDDTLSLLKLNDEFELVMVDKEIPEHRGGRPDEHIGAYLLLRVARECPYIAHLALYTSISEPNIGDIGQVYRAGASALAAPSGSDEATFTKAVEMVASGHQVVSPYFRHFGIQAMDRDKQCPLDEVEYYCVRLICEHRGKEGAAEHWSQEVGGQATVNNVSDLLDSIYSVMSSEIVGFSEVPKEKRSLALAKWYHDHAVKLYGVAVPVKYQPPSKRRESS